LDKADIRPMRQAPAPRRVLRAYPDIKACIEGHCDERGSRIQSGLRNRRATAVKQYLSLGISADRLSTVSYGKKSRSAMNPVNRLPAKSSRLFVRAN
jgi:peptidoglycan-associated lipoprotein